MDVKELLETLETNTKPSSNISGMVNFSGAGTNDRRNETFILAAYLGLQH